MTQTSSLRSRKQFKNQNKQDTDNKYPLVVNEIETRKIWEMSENNS